LTRPQVTALNVALRPVPTVSIAKTDAIAISAASKPYSIAVTPSSSSITRRNGLVPGLRVADDRGKRMVSVASSVPRTVSPDWITEIVEPLRFLIFGENIPAQHRCARGSLRSQGPKPGTGTMDAD